MRNTIMTDSTPWYRQPWPWLLMIPPVGAMIGGILTLILAIESPHAMVVDNYYKEGLAINQQKYRLDTAMAEHLGALLRSDGKHLTLMLDGDVQAGDSNLTLQFIHATRAELDRSVQLKALGGGKYTAVTPDLPSGIWYLRLKPADLNWEIGARIRAGNRFQAHLSSDER